MAAEPSSRAIAIPDEGSLAPSAARPAPKAKKAGGHYPELDGLRGIAIFLVMVHHFWPRTVELPGTKIAHLGWIGVDLFFVVSGFLIVGILYDTCGTPGYFRNFYWRRALRIFPLYYVFLVAMFLAIPFLEGNSFWTSKFVAQSGSPLWYLFYGGNIREAILGTEPAYVLAPLWSLSIEEQFYLGFPLLLYLVGRAGIRKALIAMVLFAPLFRVATMLLIPANERIQYLATPSRLDVIALGGLIAVTVRTSSLPTARLNRWVGPMLFVLVLCFALGGLDRMTPFGRTAGYSVVALTFAVVVAWAVANRGTALTALLRARPLRALGTVCYGVYLLQRPAEVVLGKVLGAAKISVPDGVTLMLLKMAFTLLIAAASWHLFEKRVLTLKRHFASVHHPSESSAG